MALSDHEKRVLAQLEQQLSAQDPQLASTLRTTGRKPVLNPRVIAWGIVMILLGLTILIAGMMISSLNEITKWVGPGLGVLGFLIMVFAVQYIYHRASTKVLGSKTTTRHSPKTKSFMQRQEERWDKRENS